ncbi:MAG: hypothetical protein ACM3Q9_01575 [Methanosarcina sp.]
MTREHPRYLCTGQSCLERLGVLYMDESRLAILRALSIREMGPREFFERVGGTSYASVRRHFLKLVDTGWLREVKTVASGRGRPEALYRAAELAVINTETWRSIPISIRDAASAILLEDMGSGLAEALEDPAFVAGADHVSALTVVDVDERSWRKATNAIEGCFRALGQEQIDSKLRLESSREQPLLMTVYLGAFEAPGSQTHAGLALPKAAGASSEVPGPRRIGKVLSDPLDLAIVGKLNHAAMTPAHLQETLGGGTTQAFLRRCKRLTKLGLATNVETRTGGSLHGARLYHFRAAAPNLAEDDILGRIPAAARQGSAWDTFREFIETSVAALDAGTFNSRPDRHLTKSTLLVDRLGWIQATDALRSLEASLGQLDTDVGGQCQREDVERFRAAFLLSSFQAPFRD